MRDALFHHWIGIVATFGACGLGLGVGLSLFGDRHSEAVGPGKLDFDLAGRSYAQLPFLPSDAPASTGKSRRHTIVVDVARKISPAVVSIGATKTTYERQYDPFGGDLFFTPYLIAPLKRNFPYLGSGILIDTQGRVVTNYHVVEDSTSIQVTLTDRRTFKARLLDADTVVDVALLQIEGLKGDEALPTLPLGNSDDIMIGETVLAAGNPFGPLIADPRPSVSMGVISAVKRSFKAAENARVYQDMIQTDAAINPGNSGGPLINLDGEAIGINTFILSESGTSSGVGFSIPINRVAKVVDDILKFGHLRAIRVDFEVCDLTPYLIQTLNLSAQRGALVRGVDIGGPADHAGLQPGDLIVAIDDKEVRDASDVIANLLTRTVGEKLKLHVVRQKQKLTLIYEIQEGKPG